MSHKLRITVGMKKAEGRMQNAEWTGGPARGRNEIEVDRPALTLGQLDLRFQPAE